MHRSNRTLIHATTAWIERTQASQNTYVLSEKTDILIVGAGPTGLVLALWLTRLGVRVRIVDKTAEPGTTSRALAVQARTLELYRQLGLADAVVARGRKMAAVNLWVSRRARSRTSSSATWARGSARFPMR